MADNALGLIETKSLKGALKVFDAATKAGKVVIASAEPAESGGVTVKIEGDWTAVQAAMEAGARAAEQLGELVSLHVVPRSDSGIFPILPYRRFLDRYSPEKPLRRETGVKPCLSQPKSPLKKKEKPAKVEPEPSPVNNVAIPSSTSKELPKPETGAESRSLVVTPPSLTKASSQPIDFKELEAMSVVKLRQYARTVANLPIQGRQISMANKQQLLEALKKAE
ncbi:MAG: BMC domain-containing protein [candidate division Zixibacteria bacterium]|nr:BMC domain-containing protein [candidate division Zixibacteria bacterium]